MVQVSEQYYLIPDLCISHSVHRVSWIKMLETHKNLGPEKMCYGKTILEEML